MLATKAEDLFSAAVVGLGLEGWADRVVVAHVGDGAPFAEPMAEWWASQPVPVSITKFDTVEGFDQVHVASPTFGPRLPAEVASHPRASIALVGTGARADTLDATHAAYVEKAAYGELLDVAAIPRFGRVGRALIELIEHVHHAVGPAQQSRVADSLRAALFGRYGRVPVNLECRDDPPALGPWTLLVTWFELPR